MDSLLSLQTVDVLDMVLQAPRSHEGVGFPSGCQRSYKELIEDMLKQISDLGTKVTLRTMT